METRKIEEDRRDFAMNHVRRGQCYLNPRDGIFWLFRDFRVKWDKGFGAGGRRGIFLLQKAVTFSFAGFLEKEDAVVGVGMMV